MAAHVLGRNAVVIGGSLAGLCAARVLADHFDRVTVLDRDRLPDAPVPRAGTPQARHIHVLLMSGRRALERLFPSLLAEYAAAGAVDFDGVNDIEWVTRAGPALRFPSRFRLLGATRDLIEWGVRRRAIADPRVGVREGVEVTGLIAAPGAGPVAGVIVRDRTTGQGGTVVSDLVVDASGRNSHAPEWLAAIGYPPPAETVVNGLIGYASRFVRRPTGRAGGWQTLYVQPAPPGRRRGGVIAPVEGDRWVVTLIGGGTDYPPTDEAGFRAFARSLPDPRFAAAVEAATAPTPVAGSRASGNRVRHYERPGRRPEGFLVLGDAACTFNPVYGQGMSAAVLGAEVLGVCLRDVRPGDGLAGLAEPFQRRLARMNARPWLLATGEDYRYAEVEGPSPGLKTRLAHRYMDRVIALATRSPRVRVRLSEVIHLLRPPTALLHPSVAARAAFPFR